MEFTSVKVIKEDDDSQTREDEHAINKNKSFNFKEHMTLIKLKMSKTDTLIRQYNDKMKECDLLNEELTTVRGEKQDILNKYNLTMEKNTRLELATADYQQNAEKYKVLTDKQKLKLDENQQHINQLLFKIKDIEAKNSALEDETKILQQDVIKASKATIKSTEKKSNVQLKQQACQTINIETNDIAMNTDPVKDVPKKPKMKDQFTSTDKCIESKKEPFSFYCTKCEAEINPAPVKQILKIMTYKPTLLSEQLSPPNSPRKLKTNAADPTMPIDVEMYEPIKTTNDLTIENESFESPSCKKLLKTPLKIASNTHISSQYSSTKIDELTQQINKLTSSLKKMKQKKSQNNCCHKNCCSSKNVQVIVKLPSEEQYFDYRKREKRKLKRLKCPNRKLVTTRSILNSTNNEWQIEDCLAPKRRKVILNKEKKKLKNKKKFTSQEKIIDLFGPENDVTQSKELLELESPSTYPSKLIEMDVDINKETCIQNASAKKTVTQSSASSSSATSQIIVSNNTNQNVVKSTNVQKEEFALGTISEENVLPLRIKNTDDSKGVVSISKNQIAENNFNIQEKENNVQKTLPLRIKDTDNFKEEVSANDNQIAVNNLIIQDKEENVQKVDISSNEIEIKSTFDDGGLLLNIKSNKQDKLITTVSNEKIENNVATVTNDKIENNVTTVSNEKIENNVATVTNEKIENNVTTVSKEKIENNVATVTNEKIENNVTTVSNEEKMEEINISLPKKCKENNFTDECESSTNTKNNEKRKKIHIEISDNNKTDKENIPTILMLHDEVNKDITIQQNTLISNQIVEMNEEPLQNLVEHENCYPLAEEQNELNKQCEINIETKFTNLVTTSANLDNTEKYLEELSSNNDNIIKNISTNDMFDTDNSLLEKNNYNENKQFENNSKNNLNEFLAENKVDKQLEDLNSDSLSSDESIDSRIFSGSEITHSSIENINECTEPDGQQSNLTAEEIQLKHLHKLPIIVTNNNQNKSVVVPSISSFNINKIKEKNLSVGEFDDKLDNGENMMIEQNNIFHKQIEITKENNNFSSDESSESRFFSASGLKRTKPNNANIILSDESSEEKSVEELNTKRRKRTNVNPNPALIKGKKLLSKIRNIKKISKNPIIINKSEPSCSQVREKSSSHLNTPIESSSHLNTSIKLPNNSNISIDTSPTSIPTKKQRIAHTPKSIDSNKDTETVYPVKREIRNIKLTPKKKVEESDDKFSSILKEYDKTCKERVEITRNLKALEPAHFEPKSFASFNNTNKPYQENLASNNLIIEQDVKAENETLSSECDSINVDSLCSLKDISSKPTNDLRIEENIKEESETLPLKCESFNIDNLSSLEDQITQVPRIKNKRKNLADALNESPIKELRSRQVVINQFIDETNSCLGNTTVVSNLNKHLSSPKMSNKIRKGFIHAGNYKKNEKFFEEKFISLTDVEEWTAEINNQILESLVYSLDLRTIALFIIDYTANRVLEGEEFDKLHTPPAPMMTRTEQKIVTLILSIDKKFPEFRNIITNGIHYKLFRLGLPQQVHIVERLFRILVVLSKTKKDREKARIFLCDALYCLNLRAIDIIHVALTCWPELLPKHDSNNDIIVKTIVHIIMTLPVNKPYNKLCSLRKNLSSYYGYPDSGYMINNFKVELLKNLEENLPGINTAVLLLCKKMGPAWTMENIVKGLKQMIVTQTHPSLYDALTLLGNILRSFPTTDPNNKVGEIIDQLCDVLAGNPESDDLQEGVVSCLLSINKIKYQQIARSVIMWQSKKDLRPATKDKLESFFAQHDAKWWWKFIKTNFPLPKKD